MFKNKMQLADVDSTKPPIDWTAEHSLFSQMRRFLRSR
jgi:hypothetical protein